MRNVSRRVFGKTVGAAAVGAAGAGSTALAQQGSAAARRFPDGFLWGCATASYKIAGGAKQGGRKPPTWAVFSHTPGKTHNGDTGDVADDSYHLYKQDVKLMRDLGVKVYRLSVAWPRVFPDGTGQPNMEGLNYYERVIDELLANG